MLKKISLAVAMLLFPVASFAACVQNDITGTWRFQFDTGTNSPALKMSCIIKIKSNGRFGPSTCTSVFNTTDSASIVIYNPARYLKVADTSEVTVVGPVKSDHDIELGFGNSSYTVDVIRLTLNLSKDVLMGYTAYKTHLYT